MCSRLMTAVGMTSVGDEDDKGSKLYWENFVMPVANKKFADMKASATMKCRKELNSECR